MVGGEIYWTKEGSSTWLWKETRKVWRILEGRWLRIFFM